MTSVRPVDGKTFEMALSQPTGLLPTAFSKPANNALYIMSKADAEADDGSVSLVGSAPFLLNKAERRPGDRMVFERNVQYVPRDEPPSGLAGARVAKVEWRSMPDPSSRSTRS